VKEEDIVVVVLPRGAAQQLAESARTEHAWNRAGAEAGGRLQVACEAVEHALEVSAKLNDPHRPTVAELVSIFARRYQRTGYAVELFLEYIVERAYAEAGLDRHDFEFMVRNTSQAFDMVTGGVISKPMTLASVVEEFVEERIERAIAADAADEDED